MHELRILCRVILLIPLCFIGQAAALEDGIEEAMHHCMDLWTRVDLIRASHSTVKQKECLADELFDKVVHVYALVQKIIKYSEDPVQMSWFFETLTNIERQFGDVFKHITVPVKHANAFTLSRLVDGLKVACDIKPGISSQHIG